MPFSSKKQARWMFANKPKMAKEWAGKTDFSKLPKRKDRKYQLEAIKRRVKK